MEGYPSLSWQYFQDLEGFPLLSFGYSWYDIIYKKIYGKLYTDFSDRPILLTNTDICRYRYIGIGILGIG